MERRSVRILDAAVPVIVGAVIMAGGFLHSGTGGARQPLAMVIGLGAALTLAGRQRSPGLTLALSAGLVLVLFHLDSPAGPIALLAPAVALYSVALTRGRIQQLIAAIAAIATIIVASTLNASPANLVETVGHVTLVAIPLLAAETLRTRRSYVSLLVDRLELAERTRDQEAQRRVEQERMRIARDLHDIVAHTLTTINVQAATAAELLDRNPGHARAALEVIEDASRDAIAELRAMVGVLRDSENPDAPRAPAPGLDNLAELVDGARSAGQDVRLDRTGTRPDRLSDAVSLAAFRIVQESLTNARRHAAGSHVQVSISFEPSELTIHVENGGGTAVSRRDATPGVGITGMTERVAGVGGNLSATPTQDGFRIRATLPYVLGEA